VEVHVTDEGRIQSEIVAWCKANGALVFRMNAGYIRGNVRLAPDGTPDLLTVWPDGSVLWAEVKVPGKGPSDVQAAMHRELRMCGQRVIVARSLEDVMRERGATPAGSIPPSSQAVDE